MNRILIMIVLTCLLGCSPGRVYIRGLVDYDSRRESSSPSQPVCDPPLLKLVSSHVSVNLQPQNNSTVTHEVRYRVLARAQCGSVSIAERKYLISDSRTVLERVERSVSKRPGEHRSSYTFALSRAFQAMHKFSLLSEFLVGGVTMMRVEDPLGPSNRK